MSGTSAPKTAALSRFHPRPNELSKRPRALHPPSAWVGAVQVPVPDDRADPMVSLARRQGEQPDRALPAFVVAVEDLHEEQGAARDVLLEPPVVRVGGVTDRGLPEADVARGDVEVAELRSERFGVGCL